MENLLTVFISAGIGLVSGLLIMLLREYYAIKREKRDMQRNQLVNLNYYFFEQYLSSEIKKCRSNIIENPDDTFSKNRISHALQRVGIMTYLGSIPLEYSLLMNGYQIIGDWVLIAGYINNNKRGYQSYSDFIDNLHKVPFERRHAEWLALIAWMWLSYQGFHTININTELMRKFVEYYKNAQNIIEREKTLFSFEKNFTSKEIVKLVKNIRRNYRKVK